VPKMSVTASATAYSHAFQASCSGVSYFASVVRCILQVVQILLKAMVVLTLCVIFSFAGQAHPRVAGE
jgi:hypothetical protein